MSLVKCSQSGCGKKAVYRYEWPGSAAAGLCGGHPDVIKSITAAMVPLSLAAQHDDNIQAKAFVVDVNCAVCDAEFKAKAADRRRGWGRFCSKTCAAVSRRKTHSRDRSGSVG